MRRIIISGLMLFIALNASAQNQWTDDDVADWISSDNNYRWLMQRAVEEHNNSREYERDASEWVYYRKLKISETPKEVIALQKQFPGGHYFILIDDFDVNCAFIIRYDAGYFYRYYVKKRWLNEKGTRTD